MIKATITGLNAILLHKYTVASARDVGTRVIKTRDSNNYSDEWIKGTYLNEDGQVIMPAINISACIFEGSKGMKIGKKALTRVVYTAIRVMPIEPLILFKGKPVTIDLIRENNWINLSGAVISGRRVDRARTMLPIGWTINFELLITPGTLTKEDVRSILDNAGIYAGLGDWRPSSPKKPGNYGIFNVTNFEET